MDELKITEFKGEQNNVIIKTDSNEKELEFIDYEFVEIPPQSEDDWDIYILY